MRVRHIAEYIGLRAALAAVDHLPLRSVRAAARGAADAWYALDGPRRRTAIANLLRSGVAPGAPEAARIARASFRHFGLLAVESLAASKVIAPDTWRDFVELQVPERTMKLLTTEGQGIILASGHLGNWEVAAQIVSYLKPVVGITRPMNNPYTDALIRRRKERDRFRLTPKHDADALRFLSVLKQGKALALLIDQHASARGMMIPFFGTPAATYTSPALLHLVTRVPLCFGYCLCTGPLAYRFVASEPIMHQPSGDRQADVRAILESLTRELETAIRAAPEQYLWAHRRWR